MGRGRNRGEKGRKREVNCGEEGGGWGGAWGQERREGEEGWEKEGKEVTGPDSGSERG